MRNAEENVNELRSLWSNEFRLTKVMFDRKKSEGLPQASGDSRTPPENGKYEEGNLLSSDLGGFRDIAYAPGVFHVERETPEVGHGHVVHIRPRVEGTCGKMCWERVRPGRVHEGYKFAIGRYYDKSHFP